MTVGEWLRTRTPPPPAALAARLDLALGADLDRPVSEAPDLFLAGGERLVEALIRDDCSDRDSALDLLAADALVTYAFEAASGDRASIHGLASTAMARIAALASQVRA